MNDCRPPIIHSFTKENARVKEASSSLNRAPVMSKPNGGLRRGNGMGGAVLRAKRAIERQAHQLIDILHQ